ncbi:hypothetical protein [Pandoraea apista]|uniref:AbiU2 domain-containing protein n=1 Tax=Pandoraea apista TaxID=93218 RepID=UPI00069AAA02|nr:hypothetical protein [Pandoraea apista]
MKSDNDVAVRLDRLKALVRAAEDEAMLAVTLHESWKPTAYDVDLHARMGTSFATHTFHVIRVALRRELLLSLVRIWDTNKRAVRLTAIADILRDDQCFEALVEERAARLTLGSTSVKLVRDALTSKRTEVLGLIRKYLQNGDGELVLQDLRQLRHQHLAHRQVETPATVVG